MQIICNSCYTTMIFFQIKMLFIFFRNGTTLSWHNYQKLKLNYIYNWILYINYTVYIYKLNFL